MKTKPEYQYYYKQDKCPAKTAEDGDCKCWHDEGTGPYKDERYNSDAPLVRWRIMRSNAKSQATDAVLEEISDKIRRGEPVGVIEAIAAINYQGHLKRCLFTEWLGLYLILGEGTTK
jgi:hypothetical protein